MTIQALIVEDDPEFADLLQVTLEHSDCRPAVASSAMAALRWLDGTDSRPDVIIVDIGLPDKDMDGLDLCRTVKRNPATRRIPVVVLTGRTDNATRLRAALAHADLVLNKPIEGFQLAQALRAILEQRPAESRVALGRGGLQLDPRRAAVSWNGRSAADFGPRLFELLYVLVESAPQALTCRRLATALGEAMRESEVYVLVCRLRAKLRQAFGVDFIETVPNRGYRVVLPAAVPR